MNVWNVPVQELFCVVKSETPRVWRWKLCEFQHTKIGNKFDCLEGVTVHLELANLCHEMKRSAVQHGFQAQFFLSFFLIFAKILFYD